MTDSNQKPFDYIAEAHVTAASNYYGNKVPLQTLAVVLETAINALNELDKVKKSLFYGRDLNITNIGNDTRYTDCRAIPEGIDPNDDKRAINIIHAIIGMATESGELLEMFYKTVFNDAAFDDVNASEEVGDTMWYQALLIRALGTTFDSEQRGNIAKLRARFPNAFTEYDANNRDLFMEREVLEQQLKTV